MRREEYEPGASGALRISQLRWWPDRARDLCAVERNGTSAGRFGTGRSVPSTILAVVGCDRSQGERHDVRDAGSRDRAADAREAWVRGDRAGRPEGAG